MNGVRVSIRMMLWVAVSSSREDAPWRHESRGAHGGRVPQDRPCLRGRRKNWQRSWGGSLGEQPVNHHGEQCFKVKDVVRIVKLSWEVK